MTPPDPLATKILTIVQVPLSELAHIVTRTHATKLRPVTTGFAKGRTLPPIWLSKATSTSPFSLEDGNHRLTAARQLGLATIDAIVAAGPEEQARANDLWEAGWIGMAPTVGAAIRGGEQSLRDRVSARAT
jgi:hypothetical protein